MKANELRVGNWVYDSWNKESYPVPIRMIEAAGQLKPIPLTEEWLLKAGLEYIQNAEWEIKIPDYSIRISRNGFTDEQWFLSILTGFGSQPVTIQIKYVHQLQNLYFALTGEELTLAEDKAGNIPNSNIE